MVVNKPSLHVLVTIIPTPPHFQPDGAHYLMFIWRASEQLLQHIVRCMLNVEQAKTVVRGDGVALPSEPYVESVGSARECWRSSGVAEQLIEGHPNYRCCKQRALPDCVTSLGTSLKQSNAGWLSPRMRSCPWYGTTLGRSKLSAKC